MYRRAKLVIEDHKQNLPMEEFRRLTGLDHVGNLMESSGGDSIEERSARDPESRSYRGAEKTADRKHARTLAQAKRQGDNPFAAQAYAGKKRSAALSKTPSTRESVDRFLDDHNVEEGKRASNMSDTELGYKDQKSSKRGGQRRLAGFDTPGKKGVGSELVKRMSRAGADTTAVYKRQETGRNAAREESVKQDPVMEEFRELAGLVRPDKPLKKVTRGTGGISLEEFKNLSGMTSRQPLQEEVEVRGREYGGLGDLQNPTIGPSGLAGYAHKTVGGMDQFLEMAGVTKK